MRHAPFLNGASLSGANGASLSGANGGSLSGANGGSLSVDIPIKSAYMTFYLMATCTPVCRHFRNFRK